MRRFRASLLGFALLSCGAASAARSEVRIWPGNLHSGCFGLTLQQCMDAAAPGDIVQVRTNDPIDEDLTINQSLTLAAEPGYAPVLGPFRGVTLVNTGASTMVFRDF